ncbi:MAG: Shikimate dehydrogenase [Streptosporangiaceae bacterium]|jgi:shikimate dehydrogenase|nr:Shikimate dehydrogenase [Streptosporangiaceae bacterium]
MRRAAVLGAPVAHSLSPVLHRAAYAALGLGHWSYEAIECREDGLPALIGGLDRSWAGLSLTMPLKRTVLPLLDEVSELAVAVGGANTVVFREGRRLGHNTDVHGIVTALAEAGVASADRPPGSALIMGGGATACSALAALHELGLSHATVAVRDESRAAEAVAAAGRLGVTIAVRHLARLEDLLPADLVISTLPGDAAGRYAAAVAKSGAAVFDVAYAPWPTPLAAAVEETGGAVVGGFPMLLHQAVRQVALMTGREDVPVEVMRRAGEAEIARRHCG